MFERYAIFYTPAEGPFADFGAAWLGWDSRKGVAVQHPPAAGVDVATLTQTPRKYGFHATLKAPFHLAKGTSEAALQDAVAAFAATHQPVALDQFAVVTTHGFLALRPTCNPVALQTSVAEIVRGFDHFRAPLTPADIARRRHAGLTDRQDRQMLEWGYPFIFDDFHFHMTLSNALSVDELVAAKPVLEAAIAPLLPEAPMLDAITLMGQNIDGMFHQIHRSTLTG